MDNSEIPSAPLPNPWSEDFREIRTQRRHTKRSMEYLCFFRENKSRFPGMKRREIRRILDLEWELLSPEEKLVYVDKARAKKNRRTRRFIHKNYSEISGIADRWRFIDYEEIALDNYFHRLNHVSELITREYSIPKPDFSEDFFSQEQTFSLSQSEEIFLEKFKDIDRSLCLIKSRNLPIGPKNFIEDYFISNIEIMRNIYEFFNENLERLIEISSFLDDRSIDSLARLIFERESENEMVRSDENLLKLGKEQCSLQKELVEIIKTCPIFFNRIKEVKLSETRGITR